MRKVITSLFGITYPIIQGGMVWVSGWNLASAVSNAGGLGLIGAGSMYSDLLEEHIQKCKKATNKPFGVNLPLLYPHIDDLITVVLKNKVPIVFTSAGNPSTYTQVFKDEGIKVVHVVSSLRFALKAKDAGVDAVVAEGFEAGGHNGREETTTFCLIPLIRQHLNLPLIAAGGIATGSGILAALALGADGVQIGSRFLASKESSAHQNFKDLIITLEEGQTQLTLKEITPVRLIKNDFYKQIEQAYLNNVSKESLRMLLGKGRAKTGMFDGDLSQGELEIGQVSALISEIKSVKEIIETLLIEYKVAHERLINIE